MPKTSSSLNRYLLSQGLNSYHERLLQVLSQQPLCHLAKKTGIKANTLSTYQTKGIYPNLPRLAAIAHECGVSLQWLLFGEVEPAKAPEGLKEFKPKEKIKQFKVLDDVMSPTIAPLTLVQYKPFRPQPKSKVFSDGIYILYTQQGEVIRRIQWRDNDECYLVFGDNPNYPQQQITELNVIGKVISIITPI